MKFKDYYQILGIRRDATLDEVKKAYHRLARKYHPDVSKDSNAEERFKEIGEAYAVLKDPAKRATYDQVGSQWKSGQEFHQPPDWDGGFEFRDAYAKVDPGLDFSDFFEALFGRGSRARERSEPHARGVDQHARIFIDLRDSYGGARRSIVLNIPARDPFGMTMQQRQLEVSIPRGVHAGQHLRLAGQGALGAGDGPAGDLYLEIAFNPDPLFRADGRDVYMELPLSPWEAALGAVVTAPTPAGPVQLTIPAGSAAGNQLRMKGRGIPGTPPGDLYVKLTIALPPATNEAARQAYRAMAKAFDFNPRAQG